MSRHPSPEISHTDEQSAEHYVNFIATHSTPKAMSLTEIKLATTRDKTLQKLMQLIQTNNWETMEDDSESTEVNVAEHPLWVDPEFE